MNDYPLSTKSSKKNTSRPNPSQSRSPLLQRSVCQAPQPQLLRKQVYGHILQGEYVFIEIYEQGRVAQTPYPEYIAFMGGLVCKRLTSKVSIFLTNLTARELGPIKQRVGRICPNCRIVSILWFQRCYQVKNKVPFDQFALDTDEGIQDDYSKQSTQEVDLGTFLSNIGEDAENDFKDFFKNEKKKFFQYLPKSHNRPIEEIFQAKPYDLGPNPEKKVKTKNPNPRKRVSRVSGKRLQNKEKKQVEDKKENEKENEDEQEKKQEQKEEDRPLVIESVVSKYLKMQEYIAEENQQVNNNSVPEKSQTTPVTSESQEPRPKPPSATQAIIPESYSKKSVQSALLGLKQKKNRQTQRFTFSKTGTLYKDITNKQGNSIDKLELEGSLAVLRRADPNVLPVIVASTAMEQKARQVNSQATHPSSLTFHILKYGLFSTISQRLPSSADIFFLINPKKPAERALFYALTIQKSALRVRLANYRLIEEVIAYNRQVKNAQSRTPIKLDRSLLRFTKQLVFEVCEQGVKGKRIVFLMSQLPWRVQQQAIQAMGGVYVHKDDYLSTTVDIIITERNFLLQARQAEAIPQEAFWKQVIRLQGQQ